MRKNATILIIYSNFLFNFSVQFICSIFFFVKLFTLRDVWTAVVNWRVRSTSFSGHPSDMPSSVVVEAWTVLDIVTPVEQLWILPNWPLPLVNQENNPITNNGNMLDVNLCDVGVVHRHPHRWLETFYTHHNWNKKQQIYPLDF